MPRQKTKPTFRKVGEKTRLYRSGSVDLGPSQKRLKLKNLQKGEHFRHNGYKGYTAIASVRSSYGIRLTRFVVIYKEDSAWVFQGVAKDRKQPYQFDDLVLASARSFRNMTAEERANADARRIHIITAKKNTRFAKLAQKSRLGPNAEAQLRLLNKHYPDGEPAPGTPLKIIH